VIVPSEGAVGGIDVARPPTSSSPSIVADQTGRLVSGSGRTVGHMNATQLDPADIAIQITFDAHEPHTLARFWAGALGYEQEDHSALIAELLAAERITDADVEQVDGHAAFREAAACSDPSGRRPRLLFQVVPEDKTVKNRMHLDLHVGADHVDDEVRRLEGLGATYAWTSDDRGPRCITLRDPEGNELCVS
jgi:Glyoxalase-like domain